MNDSESSSTTLFAIFARKAQVAALFVQHRLPTHERIQLVRWNLQDDSFEYGGCYNGTIFVKRSDVSPDGTRLLYFAAQDPGTAYDASLTSTWTAVSTIPSLDPVVLWPKGDPLAGGGLFHDDAHVWLNHRPHQIATHALYPLPDGLTVNPNPWATGEDYPIYANRLERDGWRYKQHGDFRMRNGVWVAETEEICTKMDPTRRYRLSMTMFGMEKTVRGTIYHYRFAIADLVSGDVRDLDCDGWAEWDSRGRLVYSKDGLLLAGAVQPTARLDSDVLGDFSDVHCDEKTAPPNVVTP